MRDFNDIEFEVGKLHPYLIKCLAQISFLMDMTEVLESELRKRGMTDEELAEISTPENWVAVEDVD